MRSEIVIPGSDGVAIFANQGGNISVTQTNRYDGDEQIIVLTPIEAGLAANALREVADFLKSQGSEAGQ